ncbi:enoyl-CoA hydratase-related protein [Siccirubricoccus sp. KC 17139]|uniref:Enoyl-CoA hydratase-related protein n=1 Tax=Siccirubricoccus soli TaxID=2899147 RepID=A0ABT1D1C9_9PROT|nr:enoyl-CoA hydratase-related protein [Siccirubricoccus soli]MCO6415717.1 enoyl-CoA hydratase-related protein [Siccirubricoccus soli]MCP2681849.1 enoyl-CoA hydratase-related protein [Siccirubricoccus soli]
MSDQIRTEIAEGVCTVRFTRPEKKNALTREMYAGLAEAIERTEADDSIRCLLITGSEDVFCAGNDIADFRSRPAESGPRPSRRVYQGLARLDKPVVAAVQGLAIGIGFTMLLHADLVYAAPEARFRMPFVDLGVVPELGSSLLVPWIVGRHRAAELMFLGEFFDAAAAERLGFVNRIIPQAELLPNAMATARALARKPVESLRATKRLLRPDQPKLLARMEEELEIFAERLASAETQAIMAKVLKPKA